MSKLRVAALQMVSAPELAPNLDAAGRLIAAAAAAGARLVALPENFYCIGRSETDKLRLREPEGRGPIQEFLARAAREHRVWLVGGTAPLACADERRIRSACLVYDDAGERVARYDKMHLFRFTAGDERYDESRTLEAGERPVAVASPFGRLALSVYPELYRALAPFDAMFVPSAFTVPTGAAHWETLLRARAIENQAYVIAPAQGGAHAGGRRTFGHSMIVDPWGEILAMQAQGEGVVLAEMDAARIQEVQAALPAHANRRMH
jgi:deaminated glutathione amidase